MLRIVLNIPHSSAFCPAEYEDAKQIREDLARWTDFYTDELFGTYEDWLPIQKVVYDKSRFYCDCECLFDDPMELKGEGFCYTDFKGNKRKLTADEFKNVLLDYYNYRRELGAALSSGSLADAETLLIDCHSFPGDLAPDVDICIGYNSGEENMPPTHILDCIVDWFRSSGYRVALNAPYSNSITPLSCVPYKSVMIEVNKNVYMDAYGNKTQGFEMLQHDIRWLYHCLVRYSYEVSFEPKHPGKDNVDCETIESIVGRKVTPDQLRSIIQAYYEGKPGRLGMYSSMGYYAPINRVLKEILNKNDENREYWRYAGAIRNRLKELLTPSTPDYVRAGFETEADFLLWLVPKSPYDNRAEDYKKWGFSSRDEVLDAYVKAMKLHN